MNYKNLIKDLEFVAREKGYEFQTLLLEQADEMVSLESKSFHVVRISTRTSIRMNLVLLECVLNENLYVVGEKAEKFEYLPLTFLIREFYRDSPVLNTVVNMLVSTNNLIATRVDDATYKEIDNMIMLACNTYLSELYTVLNFGQPNMNEILDMKVLEITHEQG